MGSMLYDIYIVEHMKVAKIVQMEKRIVSYCWGHGVEMVEPTGMMGPMMGWEKSSLFITVALTRFMWCMTRTASLLQQKSTEVLEAIEPLRLAQFLVSYLNSDPYFIFFLFLILGTFLGSHVDSFLWEISY